MSEGKDYMKSKERYISPEAEVISLQVENIVASSSQVYDPKHSCDDDCAIYHICRDRDKYTHTNIAVTKG